MVTHIVMFRLEGSADLVESVCRQFKEKIETLPGHIDGLTEASVGINNGTDPTNWTLALTARCTDYAALNAYAVHPEHLACVAVIKPYIAGRVCVDYTD